MCPHSVCLAAFVVIEWPCHVYQRTFLCDRFSFLFPLTAIYIKPYRITKHSQILRIKIGITSIKYTFRSQWLWWLMTMTTASNGCNQPKWWRHVLSKTKKGIKTKTKKEIITSTFDNNDDIDADLPWPVLVTYGYRWIVQFQMISINYFVSADS